MIARPDLADAERCALGPKQLALVQELAEGKRVPITTNRVHYLHVTEVGLTKLPLSSFRPLRQRLKEAGFLVTVQYPNGENKWVGWVEVSR